MPTFDQTLCWKLGVSIDVTVAEFLLCWLRVQKGREQKQREAEETERKPDRQRHSTYAQHRQYAQHIECSTFTASSFRI